jgi:uncharacterized protein (DUF1499 family)
MVHRTLLVFAALLLASGAWFFAVGSEQVWTWYAGSADQGRVENLGKERRTQPNDSLACSPATCSARTDIALPLYRERPADLMQRLDRIILADRNHLVRVDDRTRPDYRRYVARTPFLRFPDTIEALALARGQDSALVLYSRSLLGGNDWGANQDRLAFWVAELDDVRSETDAVPPPE